MIATYFLLAFAYGLIIALGAGLFMLSVELKAMQKSTHQVQYINQSADYEALTEELRAKLSLEPENV